MSKKAHQRERIDTGTSKRYVRRNDERQFKEVDDQHRSLSQDDRKHVKTVVNEGQGDKGDERRKS